jgi:hypothetical protein
METAHLPQSPRVERRGAQPYVAVRRDGAIGELRAALHRGFPELFGWLADHGVGPAGPPFARYVVFDPQTAFEIDICVPVDADVAGDHDVRADVLPAGDYVTYVHRGAYSGDSEEWSGRDLAAAHDALHAWAWDNRVAWDGWQSERGPAYRASIERYLVGPADTPDPARWETELAVLIKG